MSDDNSPMGSVDKALQALECLSAADGGGLPLGELAAALGLRKNSLHRTLAALKFRGFVIQDVETGKYQLGPSLLRLAESYFSENRMRALFHPALQQLVGEINELCHLGILDGGEIVYMDKIEPEQSIRVFSAIGRRSPALTTALGRAILAFQVKDFESLAERFPDAIPQRTAYTMTRLQDVWQEIVITRIRGYAMENQEGQEGVSCLAVPLLRGGNPICAVSVTAPIDRMNRARVGQLAATIRAILTPRLPTGLSLPTLSSPAVPAETVT